MRTVVLAILVGWCAWSASSHAITALKQGVHLKLNFDAQIQ